MSTADVKIDHDASCDGKVRLGDVTRNLELLQLWQYDSLLSSPKPSEKLIQDQNSVTSCCTLYTHTHTHTHARPYKNKSPVS